MRKLFLFCFVSSLLGFFPPLEAHIQGSLEGKLSYYHPSDQTFRKIYDDRFFFGIEGSVQTYQYLFLYTSVSLLPSSGQTIGNHYKTSLLLVPTEVGLKYLLPIENPYFDLYFGAAAAPFYVHIKNDSPFASRIRTKWDLGGAFKGGVMLFPLKSEVFLDVFVNYYLLKTKFSDTDRMIGKTADFSGLSAGTRLGYWF